MNEGVVKFRVAFAGVLADFYKFAPQDVEEDADELRIEQADFVLAVLREALDCDFTVDCSLVAALNHGIVVGNDLLELDHKISSNVSGKHDDCTQSY